MIFLLKLTSIVSLLLTIAPAVLFLFSQISLENVKLWMLLGTVGWFVSMALLSQLSSPHPVNQSHHGEGG